LCASYPTDDVKDKLPLFADLVDSIVQPATDPAAAEVFYRINHRTTPPLTLNALLSKLEVQSDRLVHQLMLCQDSKALVPLLSALFVAI